MSPLPVVVGISGATGVLYGVELLRALRRIGWPSHLVMTEMAGRTLALETDLRLDEVRSLADVVYSVKNLAAAPASGSFRTQGMIVAPCSVKTLSGIANSFSQNLLLRAADVTLKERRPLVLLFRETPLHQGHLRLMMQATEAGAILLPPMPAFYTRPQTVLDLVRQTVFRALDLIGVVDDTVPRWEGA
ncbi:MAG: UbiX family flavin prenyltransferase [Rhodospirillales bacterium]